MPMSSSFPQNRRTQALWETFVRIGTLGSPWGRRTRFVGISKLAPASVLTIDKNLAANESPYWQPKDEVVWRGGFDRIMDKWSPLVAGAVARYGEYKGDAPLLADLTAGEDARLVLAQCHALGIDYHAQVGGFAGVEDVEVVEHAAKEGGFPHTVTSYCLIEPAQLKAHAEQIVLASDGYANFFTAVLVLRRDYRARRMTAQPSN